MPVKNIFAKLPDQDSTWISESESEDCGPIVILIARPELSVPCPRTPEPAPVFRLEAVGPATVGAGGTVVYTIVVSNLGPDAVPDAIVTDPTPAGLVFQSASAPCTRGFPCSIGALGAGTSTTLTATYVVAAGFGATKFTAKPKDLELRVSVQ